MNPIQRRTMLGSSLGLLGSLATARAAESVSTAAASSSGPRAKAAPLAQDFTVVYENPDREKMYVEGSGLTRLPDGTLIAVVPIVPRGGWKKGPSRIEIVRSDDGGKQWRAASKLPYYTACPWVHDGKLYLLACRTGTTHRNDDLFLLRSPDGGATWSEPVELFKGHYWNCHTGIVVRDGRLYWAIDEIETSIMQRAPRVLAGDLTKDPLDPQSWRLSDPVPFPGIPKSLGNKKFEKLASRFLEPNVIEVNGQLRVVLRVEVQRQTTANLCAVLDLDDDGKDMKFRFNQFYPMPGGHLKFYILWDEVTSLYWATANLSVDTQETQDWWKGGGHIRGGNDRRFLMLLYGLDGLNWFQAGCIAQADKVAQSFMYATPMIDGNDLVVLSRSSIRAANNHDADFATFHRVPDFRNLALDLRPKL